MRCELEFVWFSLLLEKPNWATVFIEMFWKHWQVNSKESFFKLKYRMLIASSSFAILQEGAHVLLWGNQTFTFLRLIWMHYQPSSLISGPGGQARHHLLSSGCGVDMLAGVLQVECLVSTKHLDVFYKTPPCLAKSTSMFLPSSHKTFLFSLSLSKKSILACHGCVVFWLSVGLA